MVSLSTVAASNGTNDSLSPNQPVLTVTQFGSPVSLSRYTWPTLPMFSPSMPSTVLCRNTSGSKFAAVIVCPPEGSMVPRPAGRASMHLWGWSPGFLRCKQAAGAAAYLASARAAVLPVGFQPDGPRLGEFLLVLGRGLVAGLGVPRRQLKVLLSFDAGLELAAALDFGVDLGAEQQGQIRDPQPQEEDDDAGQGAVRLVVTGEVGDIEAEADRGNDPDQHRDARPDADPAKLGLLDVRGRVVQDR